MKSIYFALVFLCSSLSLLGQKTLLKNGFLHIGNGEVIANAAVGIEKEKIILVKNNLAFSYSVSDWDTIIDLKGKHVYPGFIAGNSTLGLTEIEAVHATNDFLEVGTFNPHVRAQIAFNVESEVIKTVRLNGVLSAQVTPRGGKIAGSSSLMYLDGWNWQDATIVKDEGIHINWPSSIQFKKEGDNFISSTYLKEKESLYAFFQASKAYLTDKKTEKDQRFEAMQGVFHDEKRVYFRADGMQEINDVIDFCLHFQIKNGVIIGGYDAHFFARKLKDAKISVMLMRPHSLPLREDDPIHQTYMLAAKLQAEGVLFCIQNEGDMEATESRNLPFLAGTAQAYGLTEEQAIASISYNVAKIMGCEKRIGSVEVGKSATLFVSEGNALDMRTNKVVLAMINGKWVNLQNRQIDLYHKYKKKYESGTAEKNKK